MSKFLLDVFSEDYMYAYLYAVNGWIKALRIAVICSTCFMWLKLVCCFFLALDACSTVAIHQWYGDKDFERNCGAGDSEKYAQFSQLHSFWRNLSWWSGRSALTSWITDRGGDSWNYKSYQQLTTSLFIHRRLTLKLLL